MKVDKFISILDHITEADEGQKEKADQKGLESIGFGNWKDKQDNIWRWEDSKKDFIKTGMKDEGEPRKSQPEKPQQQKQAKPKKEEVPERKPGEPIPPKAEDNTQLQEFGTTVIDNITGPIAPDLFDGPEDFADKVEKAKIGKLEAGMLKAIDPDLAKLAKLDDNARRAVAGEIATKLEIDIDNAVASFMEIPEIQPAIIAKDKTGKMKVLRGKRQMVAAAAANAIGDMPVKVIEYENEFRPKRPIDLVEDVEYYNSTVVQDTSKLVRKMFTNELLNAEYFPGLPEQVKNFDKDMEKRMGDFLEMHTWNVDDLEKFDVASSLFDVFGHLGTDIDDFQQFSDMMTGDAPFDDVPEEYTLWLKNAVREYAKHGAFAHSLYQIDETFDTKKEDLWEAAKTYKEDHVNPMIDTIREAYEFIRDQWGEPPLPEGSIEGVPKELQPEHGVPEFISRDRLVDVNSFARTYENIADRLSEATLVDVPEQPKVLGAGTKGVAFDLGNGKALKITSDKSEAYAMAQLQDLDIEGLMNVDAVFEDPDSGRYVILGEKLDYDLDKSNEALYDGSAKLESAFNDMWSGEADAPDLFSGTYFDDNFPQDLEFVHEEGLIDDKTYRIAKTLVDLKENGVNYDDLHGANMLWRGDTPVIIDLGYSDVDTDREIDMLENRIFKGQLL